jgi:flagellar hook-associated protein 3 FlgL
MRVTDWMRYQGFSTTYQDLVGSQLKLQRQIATGKRILAPSDDTAGAARSQRYNQVLSILGQNTRNVEEATDWSHTTENAVSTSINYIQRAQELAIQATDVTLSDADRQGITQELEQILSGLVDTAGLRHRGHALFSGSRTDVAAFSAVYGVGGEITAVNYQGNGEDRTTEITPGRNASYNMLGSNEAGGQFGVFRDTADGIDIFNTLINLRDFVAADDKNSINTISSSALTDSLAHLTEAEARLGGIQNRLISANASNEDLNEITSSALSKVSDTDIADAATKFAQLEAAYKAALATGARVMDLSLVDYLG